MAAGVAVVAAASTTAWAAVTNGDDSPRSTAMNTAPGSRTSAGSPTPHGTPGTPALGGTPVPASTGTPGPTSLGTPGPASTGTPGGPALGGPAQPQGTAGPSGSKPSSSSSAKSPAGPKTAKAERVSKPRTRVISSGTCGASFYGEPQMTASGERFNPSAMTAAHKTLPLGSRVRVTNPNNGDSVTVRINDRGPYVGGRCLDLSEAAFDAIGNTGAGVMTVKYEVLAR
ncbi:septal ring lytic transglycosylase RlpA family protein [Nonomuraea sp. NPDC050790]|uniref:septal ring lytic transglycosylase RlpA family protein n=1 Tax=Nonomuraea sp. NPDC050790 TaxID=3364371 RepID=UPI00378B0D31